MFNRSFILLLFFVQIPASALAGSRGVHLAFLDATTGERSPASLRLAELFEKDMRQLYLDPKLSPLFPWNETNLKLQVLSREKTGIVFDRLLETKDPMKLSSIFEKIGFPDGLIVLFHDSANGFARIKLYASDGTECLLLRLPLEGKTSAMPSSLLKGKRHGALVAVGSAVRWSP